MAKMFHLLGIGPVTLEETKFGQITAKADTYSVLEGYQVKTKIVLDIKTDKGDKSEVLWFDEWIGISASENIFFRKLQDMMPEGKTLVGINL